MGGDPGRLAADERDAFRLAFWLLLRYRDEMAAVANYPNAPVVLVATEARLNHSDTDWASRIGPTAGGALAAFCPVYQPATLTTLVAEPGLEPQVSNSEVPRWLSRDRTVAVSFRDDSVVVETTDHRGYDSLRSIMDAALDARIEAGPVEGITRLGLRYIDEIRVPEAADGEQGWEGWLNPELTAPGLAGSSLGLTATSWQGLVSFNVSSEQQLVLRYGPRDGYAVDPVGDLKRAAPSPGLFFLLDIDSFWLPEGVPPQPDRVALIDRLDGLHQPIRALFESLITDRLRNEVFQHAN